MKLWSDCLTVAYSGPSFDFESPQPAVAGVGGGVASMLPHEWHPYRTFADCIQCVILATLPVQYGSYVR
jgi:hypothetical protein